MAKLYSFGARRRRPPSNNIRPILRLLPFLMRYRNRMMLAVLALIIAAGATLTVPVAVRRVIDHGFSGATPGDRPLPSIDRGLLSVAFEVIGLLILAWGWRRFGLADPRRRRLFWRTGHLDPALV